MGTQSPKSAIHLMPANKTSWLWRQVSHLYRRNANTSLRADFTHYTMPINPSMPESSEEVVPDENQESQVGTETQSANATDGEDELRMFLAYPDNPTAACMPAPIPAGSATREWTYPDGLCAVQAFLAVSESGHLIVQIS